MPEIQQGYQSKPSPDTGGPFAVPAAAESPRTLGSLLREAMARVEAHLNALAEAETNNLVAWAQEHGAHALTHLKSAAPAVVMLEEVLAQLEAPAPVVQKPLSEAAGGVPVVDVDAVRRADAEKARLAQEQADRDAATIKARQAELDRQAAEARRAEAERVAAAEKQTEADRLALQEIQRSGGMTGGEGGGSSETTGIV